MDTHCLSTWEDSGCPFTFFSPTQNNGNVQSQTILRNNNNSWSQTYAYDSVNRLLSVSETPGTPWRQTYGYDQYGNWFISPISTIIHNPRTIDGIHGIHGHPLFGGQTMDVQDKKGMSFSGGLRLVLTGFMLLDP